MSFDQKAYNKAYREAHKERLSIQKREWRERNQDRLLAKERLYRAANKERLNAQNKAWKKANPDKMKVAFRRQNLRQKYGMSVADYEAMVAEQNGVCAVCEQPEKLEGWPLSVDHCHITGKVRALLCNDCNRNLIAHRLDPAIFYKAAAYIEKHNGPRT